MSSKGDKAKSIRAKLVNIAKKAEAPFEDIQTQFLLERLVARLASDASASKSIVFKGGYVALRVYESARYTVDVDATILSGNRDQLIGKSKILIEKDLADGAWFRFEKKEDLALQNEYGGTRLVFRCGLGEPPTKLTKPQIVHFDIGTGDPITPKPISSKLKSMLDSKIISWQTYPIETSAAEKLHSLIKLGGVSSRSKDIFDLSWMLERCDKTVLDTALKRTFEYRGDELPSRPSEQLKDLNTTILRRGWTGSIGELSREISFDTAFSKVLLFLKKTNL